MFYNYTRTHYHFIWNTETRSLKGEIGKTVLDCNLKNFPWKCFYSETREEIYLFYRQGQTFNIDPNDLGEIKYQKIIDKDLG